MILSMTSFTETPSASALKFRNDAMAENRMCMARTSSMSGEYFPLSNALHLAPSTMYYDARGPAPHSNQSLVGHTSAPAVKWPSLTAYSTTLSAMGTCEQMLKWYDLTVERTLSTLTGLIGCCGLYNGHSSSWYEGSSRKYWTWSDRVGLRQMDRCLLFNCSVASTKRFWQIITRTWNGNGVLHRLPTTRPAFWVVRFISSAKMILANTGLSQNESYGLCPWFQRLRYR